MKFGANGILYCNSIKYNYKQARNIIYNNCDGHDSNEGWSTSNVGATSSVLGYKSGKCFKFTQSSNPIMRQTAFTPTANHKYYGSVMWKTPNSTFSTGDCRYEWWCNDTSTGKLTFANMNTATSGNWVKLSSIQSISSVTSGTWIIRLFLVNPTSDAYVCKMIIVDLTDTFGAGNEPSKAWCDANILEHEKLCACNYTAITSVSYSGLDTSSAHSYSDLNSSWEPRDDMQRLVSSTSKAEGFETFNSIYLNNAETYYGSIEVCDYYKEGSTENVQYFPYKIGYDFYFPIAEPYMGNQQAVTHRLMNGGGGMKDWRRVSAYNTRTSFTSGNYQWRFDFNNHNYSKTIRVCNQNIIWVDDILASYNSFNNVSAVLSDINKQWCDRWIDGRNSPIIHIKDPAMKNVVIIKPMQEIKRSSVISYTKAEIDSYVGLTSDTWDSISNTSELKAGELAFISFTETTNNLSARMIVKILSVGTDSITTDNYGWGVSTSSWYKMADGYDVQCNDIEIRPEINYISIDSTGTIKCKKLVTEF